jgi:SAM-dependent methyltransferase
MEIQAARIYAAAIRNAAVDLLDDPRLSFWDRFGRRTVERLGLAPGSSVLDLFCGAGGSALPAAERVGPAGRVLGIDPAESLLARARVKAAIRRLRNVELRAGDPGRLRLEPGSFDAVLCGFGIVALPDMAAAMRQMWSWVREGGRLAVTAWGPRRFQPGDGLFREAVRAERPDLDRGLRPWERIADPAALRALFAESGIAGAEVDIEEGFHPTPEPEDWWRVVMGSDDRGTLDALDPAARARVRERTLEAFAATGARQVEANVLYAVAAKERTG